MKDVVLCGVLVAGVVAALLAGKWLGEREAELICIRLGCSEVSE